MKIKDLGEFALIDRIKEDSVFNSQRLIQGIGDDAAVEKVHGGLYQLSTCDMLLENVHFLREHITPRQLGYKSVAVNLSDIAAMGGTPTGVLVSLGLPGDLEVEYIDDYYSGLKDLCREYGVNLLGGDLISSPQDIIVNVTALGEVHPDKLILRSGAKVGDALLVTGTVGDSRAGLEIIKSNYNLKIESDSKILARHLAPAPPLQEGEFLASSGCVTAMNDISDGLANEITEIAVASNVGVKILSKDIPISGEVEMLAAKVQADSLDWALYGGEDYQLVLTCNRGYEAKLQREFEDIFKRKLYKIGEVINKEEGIVLERGNMIEPMKNLGYTHFK